MEKTKEAETIVSLSFNHIRTQSSEHMSRVNTHSPGGDQRAWAPQQERKVKSEKVQQSNRNKITMNMCIYCYLCMDGAHGAMDASMCHVYVASRNCKRTPDAWVPSK